MALEVIYETFTDPGEIFVFPRMYKVYKEDGQELSRSLAEFSEASEGSVSSYILEFKQHISELLLSLPEAEEIDAEAENTLRTIVSAMSYLRGAVPVAKPVNSEEEPAE
jgi:hypothetical protein